MTASSSRASGRLLSRVLLAALDMLDAALLALGRGLKLERVHQARVAARWASDTAAVFHGAKLPVLKRESRRLKAALGQVRDLQLRGATGGIQLAAATKRLEAATLRWRRLRSRVEAEVLAAEAPSRARLEHRLHRRLKHLRGRISRVPHALPVEPAHRLRLKLKRARAAVAVLAPDAERLLEALKQGARLLGELHDWDVGIRRSEATRRKRRKAVAHALGALQDELGAFLDG